MTPLNPLKRNDVEYVTKALYQGGYEANKAEVRPELVAMFERFDTDGNGFLDVAEEKGLVNSFLILNAKFWKERMKKTFADQALKKAEIQYPADVSNPIYGISLEGFKEVILIMVQHCHYPAVDKCCEDMLHDQLARIDEVAASLFKSLDTNNDGLISKDELCEHFYSAMHGFSEPNPAMQLQMAQRIGISCEAFTPKLTEEIGERMECQCMLM